MRVQRGLITLSGGDFSGEAVLDTPVPVGYSFVVSSVRSTPYRWSSPYDHTDWEESWEDESLAYDGDINTHAFTDSNDYLEFPFDGLIVVDEIRIMVRFVLSNLTLGTPDIDLDVFDGEEWHNIFSGDVENDEWKDIIPYVEFESARIKFNNEFSVGDYGFLAELQIYESTAETLPTTLCRVELDEVVGDDYTKIKATRYVSSNHITNIDWQVVYGGEFTVQTGILDCNNSLLTVTQSIDSVNRQSSFIVHTNYTNNEQVVRGFFNDGFISNTEIGFSRGVGEEDDINSIRWYAVEWDGANVKEYYTELEETSIIVDIDEINPIRAFLISSYMEVGENQGHVFSRSDIISSGEVSFTRYGDGEYQDISFFVVEFELKFLIIKIARLKFIKLVSEVFYILICKNFPSFHFLKLFVIKSNQITKRFIGCYDIALFI